MATLVSSYREIGFSILPHTLDTSLQKELSDYPAKHVIGYVTYNNNEYKFFNSRSETYTESNTHWSLEIIKRANFSDSVDTWIVFDCAPKKTAYAFQHILHGEKITIDAWDTWAVEGVDAKVAVITSWALA